MKLSKYLDSTVLKPETTREQVAALCEEAVKYDVASVCVNPCHAAFVTEKLKGSDVKTCVVIGFPLGANAAEVKAFETKKAIADGATEVDMVINIGALKEGRLDDVKQDIFAVVGAAADKALVKVIIECCLLTPEEMVQACQLAEAAGAAFVKTSTGFSTGGATEQDVKRMRHAVSAAVKVKASGGIRDLETAKVMIAAGAERLGTSSAKAILEAENK